MLRPYHAALLSVVFIWMFPGAFCQALPVLSFV
jgi:hypothetical protein